VRFGKHQSVSSEILISTKILIFCFIGDTDDENREQYFSAEFGYKKYGFQN
jgi:hypothetical protein